MSQHTTSASSTTPRLDNEHHQAEPNSLSKVVRRSIGGNSTERDWSPLNSEPNLWKVPSQQFQHQKVTEINSINSKSLHKKFTPVSIHTAICDRCNNRNSSILQRCCACSKQHCYNCMYDGGGDSIHIPIEGEVDWTDRGAHSRSRMRNGITPRGKGEVIGNTKVVRRSARTVQKKKVPLPVKSQIWSSSSDDKTASERQVNQPFEKDGSYTPDETDRGYVRRDEQLADGTSGDHAEKGRGRLKADPKRIVIDEFLDTIPSWATRKQLIVAWQMKILDAKEAQKIPRVKKHTDSSPTGSTWENNDRYRRFSSFLKGAQAAEEARETNPQIMAIINDRREDDAEEILEAATILLGMSEPQ